MKWRGKKSELEWARTNNIEVQILIHACGKSKESRTGEKEKDK